MKYQSKVAIHCKNVHQYKKQLDECAINSSTLEEQDYNKTQVGIDSGELIDALHSINKTMLHFDY